jgi:23S rRNA (adenine2030-N6)-methyltransferase
VGDVWKHCALVAVLDRLERSGSVRFLDAYAGEGSYPLGPTGEWSEGIGRLWRVPIGDGAERPVTRYLDACRGLVGSAELRRYPGSPAIARALLAPGDRIALWERDPVAFERLEADVASDARVVALRGDGLAALAEAAADAEREPGEVTALLDPTYLAKAEWLEVPDALAAAARRTTRTRFLLWYPVKSLTRPNAMLARLEAAGMAGTVAELITTPLELQRNRLNGSGVLFVRPPVGVLPAIAAAAATLGPLCATQGNAWSVRIRSFGEGRAER